MKYSHQMSRQREEQVDYSEVWVGSALDEGSEIVAAPGTVDLPINGESD